MTCSMYISKQIYKNGKCKLYFGDMCFVLMVFYFYFITFPPIVSINVNNAL